MLKDRTVTVEKKVLAALWYLCTPESYRSVADRFNFYKGALHRVREEVCTSLLTLQSEYIKWPSVSELKSIADEFEKKTGFLGIIGAVDGTHIAIPGPKEPSAYTHVHVYQLVYMTTTTA